MGHDAGHPEHNSEGDVVWVQPQKVKGLENIGYINTGVTNKRSDLILMKKPEVKQ